MRAVVQRVSRAAAIVAGETVGRVDVGLLAYVAAQPDDRVEDIAYVADKLTTLRVFPDDEGRLNRSVLEIGGGILLVSAFTVMADARRGRRPSLDGAAPGAIAQPLIEQLVSAIAARGATVAIGRFAADMRVESANDGPICLLLDSRRAF